jgi:predicted acylesterase/phospholipase RssA
MVASVPSGLAQQSAIPRHLPVAIPGLASEPSIPLVWVAILAVIILIGAPIVRVTEDLTNAGFTWIVTWVAASSGLFVLWAGSEVRRTDGLIGTLATIAKWKIWSSNSIELLRKTLWLLFLLSLTLTVIALIPYVTRHQRFIVTVLGLLAAIRYWREIRDFLKTIRIPVQSLSALARPLTAALFGSLVSLSISISAGLVVAAILCTLYILWTGAVNKVARDLLPRIATALVMSLLVGWGLVSAAHSGVALMHSALLLGEARERVLNARRQTVAEWKGPVLALTLSGGGYRAALTHAGLLWALDQARIPVHIMSTVSGGSIVGAAYSAGWTPERFRDYLAETRPGLSEDVLNLGHVIRRLIDPKRGSGETFADHLARNYYSAITLDQTGPPFLIVNATDFNSGQRAAFWPHTLPATDLAHLVAASGAFPGAFDPVYLGDHPYIDGGVVENLGVEGLRKCLDEEPTETVPTPGILIISDLSAEPPPPPNAGVPSLMSAALRADGLVYQQLHSRIFKDYTNGGWNTDAPQVAGYSVSAAMIWPHREGSVRVFVLSPTSKGEIARMRDPGDRAVAEAVARIGTLVEPSENQVRAGFWLGTWIAREYLPALCQALRRDPCPQIQWPERPTLPQQDEGAQPITAGTANGSHERK